MTRKSENVYSSCGISDKKPKEYSANIMKDVIIMRKREIVPTLSSFGISVMASGSRAMARGRPPQSTESKWRQN